MSLLMAGLGLEMHLAPGQASISLQTYFIGLVLKVESYHGNTMLLEN
jgi:hypothetical protein